MGETTWYELIQSCRESVYDLQMAGLSKMLTTDAVFDWWEDLLTRLTEQLRIVTVFIRPIIPTKHHQLALLRLCRNDVGYQI